jgi:hypothetical protein
MDQAYREGQEVVTSDDQKLGHVVGVKGDCVLIESGHVFKARHAIPRSFLHEVDGTLRATVAKDIVSSSPKVDGDDWDCRAVLVHYGLEGPFEVDPDPDGLESAETVGARVGVEPEPRGPLGEAKKPGYDIPAVRDRPPNAYDPTGTTANEP